MNAANEVAVAAFLEDRIGFLEIPDVVEDVMSRWNNIEDPTVEDLLCRGCGRCEGKVHWYDFDHYRSDPDFFVIIFVMSWGIS